MNILMRTMVAVSLYLICLTANSAFLVSESNTPYKKVNIYFVDWDFQPRYNLEAEYIRENPHLMMGLTNKLYIDNFVSWLDIQSLKPVNGIDNFNVGEVSNKKDAKKLIKPAKSLSGLINVRLVIDFFKDNGNKESYVSDGYWLYSSDGKKARQVEEKFRNNFSSFWKAPMKMN